MDRPVEGVIRGWPDFVFLLLYFYLYFEEVLSTTDITMHSKAIVRKPGRNFAEGISTSGLGKPDSAKALEQHEAYCNALTMCGLEVIVLEADERYPDGCFVEDTAIVTSGVAVLARPGAASRIGEEVEISKVLSQFKEIVEIESPGTLDGGDVLRVDDHFFIGISGRTNNEGARQLYEILVRYGYTASTVVVGSGLHLKSGIAYLGKGNFISVQELSGITETGNFIIADPDEAYSANCLAVNYHLLIPKGFPKSGKKIAGLGYRVIELDISEFRKMDGGLTCLSLLL
jgi:dimethylargininase